MLDSSNRKSNNQSKDSDRNTISASPTISLPKGGSAIKGMGEKFAANPVTGTGSMTIPIVTSPGRSGFRPQLVLSYDSGGGNGMFGMGWSLSLPSITRKTDKGLPRYWDKSESDVFILSGAEDLVPIQVPDEQGKWQPEIIDPRTVDGKTYTIHRFRPRIEGLFARIERWSNQNNPQETFWRSISKDNITTWYGRENNSRIFDPDDPNRIFSWLICESYDDKGNVIIYRYKEEDSAEVELSQLHERNRTNSSRSANRYLKLIRYGNHKPYLPELLPEEPWPTPSDAEAPDGSLDWFFEVIFDYGEHDQASPTPNELGVWPVRKDPFSSYRSGFEVRTYRLCQRVLMFHHFADEEGVGQDCLVRLTDFTYSYEEDPKDARNPIYSKLISITQIGYERNPKGGYFQKSFPPLEFTYSEAKIDETVHEVDPSSLENLPVGLDGKRYQWVDLDGEGLSGILTEQGAGWFYKRNLSPINTVQRKDTEKVEVRFAPIELLDNQPSVALASGAQFLDLAGDRQLDVVNFRGLTPGFYERTHDQNWKSFVAFKSLPMVDWENPNLKFIDLNSNGLSDILITEEHCFVWYPSLAEDGFGAAERSPQPGNEEKGPRIVFADGTQSIYLADLSGDSLTDIVRIRNGEVCYWPNLGYGRFGAKVTMDNSPWFDAPDIFNQRRIVLADIDGSGTTDILYLSGNGVQVYFNQSGNSWSAKQILPGLPAIDNVASVTAIDLLGNGTACLVWSSPLASSESFPMRYIDLMGGQKPHLLIRMVNNLGAETIVQYAPSTKFYLQDKLAGQPWITKLPFPVHVVERVETYDRISRNRFVTRYAYHHGYFDGLEREFRGFGMVEQWDTEEFAALSESAEFLIGENIDAASHIPPVHTKTWFHTGVYLGRDRVSNYFAGLLNERDLGEYYREPDLTDDQARPLLLEDTILPTGLTVEEEREACRALKGSMLRQEVYALDGTDKAEYPYTVTEQNFTIRVLQQRGDNRYGMFFTHPREAINYDYERNPDDPRISHALTLEVDNFGNVLRSVAIGYGRRQADEMLSLEDRNRQKQILMTCTENDFTNAVVEKDAYRTPLPSDVRTYEVTGLELPQNQIRFDFTQLQEAIASLTPIPYHAIPTPDPQEKRLLEQSRTLYRRNDLSASLPLGQLESLALPYESYQLAFTPEHLELVYGDQSEALALRDRITETLLTDEGHYVHFEGDSNWWIRSGQVFMSPNEANDATQELVFAQQNFFLPHRFRDPFGQTSFVTYDNYNLLLLETRDPLKNRVTAGERDNEGNVSPKMNYRVLQPELMTEPNGNRSAVAFDVLGMVGGTAVMGKTSESLGDLLDNFPAQLTQEQIDEFFAEPRGAITTELLGNATSRIIYDETRFQRLGLPPFAATIVRETHVSDLGEGEETAIQVNLSYSDGFGREIQQKVQAEPGPIEEEGEIISPRWTTSGWTIFNNKGKPVKQYEPFFCSDHQFEFGVTVGVSPTLFYDPVGRVVATLHPNHTWEKVIFDPWHQETWDVNDTVMVEDPASDPEVGNYFERLDNSEYLPTWYQNRIDGDLGNSEQIAAQQTCEHKETPTIVHFDSLGRPFLSIADNGADEKYPTRTEQDIEGNPLRIIDDRGNVVMKYQLEKEGSPTVLGYDVAGRQLYENSMDAGERWVLSDIGGKPIRSWDSRGHILRSTYDELQRPIHLFVQREGEAELLAEKTVYGEGHPNAESLNLRGQVYQSFDGSGVITSDAYDFKGNLLRSRRQLTREYRQTVNWAIIANSTDVLAISNDAQPLLEREEIFTASTTYDALNRPISAISPDNSETRPIYNEANFLERLEVRLRGANNWTTFVNNIDYNAKGQRELIEYGNGVRTVYTYNPETFRLDQMQTRRTSDSARLQDLSYTYDPVGNITEIRDEAQQTIFFNNTVVSPNSCYKYDALYRLVWAKGREHIGQTVNNLPEHRLELKPHYDFNDITRRNLAHPHNGQAMRSYTQEYKYDAVGNILCMSHQANGGGWTRHYDYATDSNRLRSTSLPIDSENQPLPERYLYDAHGNMTKMPHLEAIQWDFKDRLQQVDLGGGGTLYCVYDASGERVRKVHEHNGFTIEERIYLGGYEIYRRRNASGLQRERETLHVMDDQQRIALVETKTVDIEDSSSLLTPVIRHQLGNHLGSASLELDGDGAVISYEEYHPYGTTAYQAGRSVAEVSLKRYRYTVKERDEETGLYYHGARYYAPWLGRWTATDPSGLQDSVNLFSYVTENPINLYDPKGRRKKKATSGGVRFSPKSQISAQQMVEMIKKNEKLEPWMKDLFVAKDDRIILNPKKVSGRNIRLPADVDWGSDVPEWFKKVLLAVNSNEWYVTTGVSFVSDQSKFGLKPDIDNQSKHFKQTPPKDNKITLGQTNISEEKLLGRKNIKKNSKDPSVRRSDEGLIIVASRFRHSENSGRDVPRDEEAIVETFFHELAAHAALISEGKDEKQTSHKSPDWKLGLWPPSGEGLSEADTLAKEVSDFFDNPNEQKKIEYAEALGLINSIGVITDLQEGGKLSEEKKKELQFVIEVLQRRLNR